MTNDKDYKAWTEWLKQFGTEEEKALIAIQIRAALKSRGNGDYNHAANSIRSYLNNTDGDLPLWGTTNIITVREHMAYITYITYITLPYGNI